MVITPKIIRMILKWSEEGLSQRIIVRKAGIGKGTLYRLLEKAKNLDITSIEAESMDDKALMLAFYPSKG